MSWVRLWLDMPTDPKFRVVAKRSGRPLPEVIALFAYMLTVAGRRTGTERTQTNASERGELFGWSDDDAAAALDIETAHVSAIYQAMQGKVLDGNRLINWQKRQPLREDNSAERAKRWRERKRTQTNASEPPDSDTDISDEDISFRSELDTAREKSEQCSDNGSAKGAGKAPAKRTAPGGRAAEAYHDALKRAEGFGLAVDELEAATKRARPRDPAAYFAALAVNQIQAQIPTVKRELIASAMAGQARAFTLVHAAMMGAPS